MCISVWGWLQSRPTHCDQVLTCLRVTNRLVHFWRLSLDQTSLKIDITVRSVSSFIGGSCTQQGHLSKLVAECASKILDLQSAFIPLIQTDLVVSLVHFWKNLSLEIGDWQVVVKRCRPLNQEESIFDGRGDWIWLGGLLSCLES